MNLRVKISLFLLTIFSESNFYTTNYLVNFINDFEGTRDLISSDPLPIYSYSFHGAMETPHHGNVSKNRLFKLIQCRLLSLMREDDIELVS